MLRNEGVLPYVQYYVCLTTSPLPFRDHKPLDVDYHIGNTAAAAGANSVPVQVANSRRRLACRTFLADFGLPTPAHCRGHLGGRSHRFENHQHMSHLLRHRAVGAVGAAVAVAVAGLMESPHS